MSIPPPPTSARAWHCTTRLETDAVLVRDDSERRAVVRAILRNGRRAGLIAFAVVDTHLHALFVGERAEVGEAMRCIELSCHRRLGLRNRFDGARILPVRDQHHLRNVVPYILDQVKRHDLWTDPLQEGSALQDLLGLRPIGAFLSPTLQADLPRLSLPSLWRRLGVEPEEAFAWAAPLGTADLPYLQEAALAAFAAQTTTGRSRHQRRVRAAMAHAAAGLSARKVGRAVGVTHSTVARLWNEPVPVSWVEAIRRQVRLRRRLAEGGSPPGGDSVSDPRGEPRRTR